MTTADTHARLDSARQQLQAIDQAHVLAHADALDEDQLSSLLDQIDEVDWPEVGRLVQSHVLSKPHFDLDPARLDPAPWYPYMPEAGNEADYTEARNLGVNFIKQGKVAAFMVAGGQGTRLGWDGPKGTFPATTVRKAPLFLVFAESILGAQKKYGATIPWYVMTSPINHRPTIAFFKQHDHFGLDPANVMFFSQQMMPAFDIKTGKVLLEAPGTIAMSPNGHGGSLKALYTSGAIADMKKRCVEQISYIQVDNPLVKVIDPMFIGLHARDDAQMSSKMLPKAYPKEKLGNFCLLDGKMTVIEYSDLPDELAEQRNDDGSLRFRAGSIALHAIRVDFVDQLCSSPEGFGLPWHRAEKKVAYWDNALNREIVPDQPNAVKLETFVFDALPLGEKSIVYETDRGEEFAPIKNADGNDSAATSLVLQSERAARWLTLNGVHIPRDQTGQIDATIEVTHLAAVDPDDLQLLDLPRRIQPGSVFLLSR